jgi:hypothetical protein
VRSRSSAALASWAATAVLLAIDTPLARADSVSAAALLRYRVLAADTIAAGQPVQGISSIKPGPRAGQWWALSDNGFGTKWNSLDYFACVYLFNDKLRLLRRIALRDPQRHFQFALTRGSDPTRRLTGGDIDPESLVVMADGSFWIGDEFGPWLLHFSRRGILLGPPVAGFSPTAGELRSPNHPRVLAGEYSANVGASRGFEGLALVGAGRERRLLALLEGSIVDEPDPRDLQMLEFDPSRRRWTGRFWRYRLDSTEHAIGELATLPTASQLLVLESDRLQGAQAVFKRVFRLAAPAVAPSGSLLTKLAPVDLLDVRDPGRLAGADERLRFSYSTIESIHALAADAWVVVNDNNFPAGGGRGGAGPDPTEWLWLKVSTH